MRNIIIGHKGEVGSSLYKIFKGKVQTDGYDLNTVIPELELIEKYDFLHICIPYSEKFTEIVKEYEERFKKLGGITVIHSTVPVGTTRKLNAVHSPIHGIHPNLENGIKIFVKFIGGEKEPCEKVAELYRLIGIKPHIVKNSETSELSKLGCTTRHGLMIIEQKEFKKLCEWYGADFEEAYTFWNGLYSMGYRELGLPYLQRVIVKDMPGKIGGHCILSNLDLLGGPVAEFVKLRNEEL